MKRLTTTFIVLSVVVLFAARAWAHGIGGLGMGGHRGGFQGGFGHFGHPGVSHFQGGFGHFGGFHGGFGFHHFGPFAPFSHERHFAHELFFGPHHHFGAFVPFGHERHFEHELFFGPHHHFGPGVFAFRSFGFAGGDFFVRNWFGPAGPPPFGAAGPSLFAPAGPPVVIISSPFFCFPHGLGFTDQALFADHLFREHGIPPTRAFSFCTPVGGGSRWIFFGF